MSDLSSPIPPPLYSSLAGSNCSVLMCISRLLDPITWGIWTALLYSALFFVSLRYALHSAYLLCSVALHTMNHPFSRPPLWWGYRIIAIKGLGLVFGDWNFRISVSIKCSPKQSTKHQIRVSNQHSVTPIQGDIYYPNYAWTAFPRLVCAEGYIVPGRLNSEV